MGPFEAPDSPLLDESSRDQHIANMYFSTAVDQFCLDQLNGQPQLSTAEEFEVSSVLSRFFMSWVLQNLRNCSTVALE